MVVRYSLSATYQSTAEDAFRTGLRRLGINLANPVMVLNKMVIVR
jgi:hypothetical protein